MRAPRRAGSGGSGRTSIPTGSTATRRRRPGARQVRAELARDGGGQRGERQRERGSTRRERADEEVVAVQRHDDRAEPGEQRRPRGQPEVGVHDVEAPVAVAAAQLARRAHERPRARGRRRTARPRRRRAGAAPRPGRARTSPSAGRSAVGYMFVTTRARIGFPSLRGGAAALGGFRRFSHFWHRFGTQSAQTRGAVAGIGRTMAAASADRRRRPSIGRADRPREDVQ